MCTNEFKGLVAGEYGTTPMPIDPAFQKKIIGDKKIIKGRPADQLKPELDKLRGEIEQWIEQPEDVLSYAQFPKVALDFFEREEMPRLASTATSLTRKIWFTQFDLTTKINIYATFAMKVAFSFEQNYFM